MSQIAMLLGACVGAMVFIAITMIIPLSTEAEVLLATLTLSLFSGLAMMEFGE